MSAEDFSYHNERAQKCRQLAEAASDPDVRRRHEELADLHASRAAEFTGYASQGGMSATA